MRQALGDQSTIGLQLNHKQSTDRNSNSDLAYKRIANQRQSEDKVGGET